MKTFTVVLSHPAFSGKKHITIYAGDFESNRDCISPSAITWGERQAENYRALRSDIRKKAPEGIVVDNGCF